MDPLELSRRLAGCVGVAADEAALAFLRAEPWQLVEWSLNPPAHGRGRLRVSAWRKAAAAPALGLEAEGIEGIGLALYGGHHTRRWYREAPPGRGEALYRAARALDPRVAEAADRLVQAAGGPHLFGALGTERDGGRLRRVSVYVAAPDRVALGRMCAAVEVEPPAFPPGCLDGPSWSRVYVALSLGDAGGVKLYYGARNHVDRPDDAALLAGIEDPTVFAARDLLAKALGRPRVVQVLGWGPGGWTVYFGER